MNAIHPAVVLFGLAAALLVCDPIKAQPPASTATSDPTAPQPSRDSSPHQPGAVPLQPDWIRVSRGWIWYSPQILAEPDESSSAIAVPAVLERLQSMASQSGRDKDKPPRCVFLSLSYDPQQLSRDDVQAELNGFYTDGDPPPVAQIVASPNPQGRSLAADAVFKVETKAAANKLANKPGSGLIPPDRDILFISGRAADDRELEAAVTNTMNELFHTAAHFGSRPQDVIQVKAFIRSMQEAAVAEQAIRESFGKHAVPTVVLMEWTSSLQTEIEMIAMAPDQAKTNAGVSYHTPPGDRPSPVFSRVARVHADALIFFAGVMADDEVEPAAEVKAAFARLQQFAAESGTDLRHLVKATYYVASESISSALNEVRPGLYDPQRPPAASKVAVDTIGIADRGLLMDFIAVPVASQDSQP